MDTFDIGGRLRRAEARTPKLVQALEETHPNLQVPASEVWLPTFMGGKIHPFAPQLSEIIIEDIAHGLSQICRFAGQSKQFSSVAQHSILVSRLCPPQYAFAGLMHDAAEAYILDIPAPIKYADGMAAYRNYEEALQSVIAQRFGIVGNKKTVKAADRQAFEIEAYYVLNGESMDGRYPKPEGHTYPEMMPREAEYAFLNRFFELYDGPIPGYD